MFTIQYIFLLASFCVIQATVHLQAWVRNSNDVFAGDTINYYVNWGINDIRIDGGTYSAPKGLRGKYYSIIDTKIHIPNEATWSGNFRIRSLERNDSSTNIELGDQVYSLERGSVCFSHQVGNGNEIRYDISWFSGPWVYQKNVWQKKKCQTIRSLSCSGTHGCINPWNDDRGWGRKLANTTDYDSSDEYASCNDCLQIARETFPEANL